METIKHMLKPENIIDAITFVCCVHWWWTTAIQLGPMAGITGAISTLPVMSMALRHQRRKLEEWDEDQEKSESTTG